MKNILILEDSDSRIEHFNKNFKNVNITFTKTSKECVELLIKNTYDYLFLDHDLGDKVFCESDDNSGFMVAKWLSENIDRKPNNIYIHSLNPIGQRNMINVLPEAKPAPFIWNRSTQF